MSNTADVLRGQIQALTAFSFSLALGLVAKGVLSAPEMREIIETIDDHLSHDQPPIPRQVLTLMTAISEQ